MEHGITLEDSEGIAAPDNTDVAVGDNESLMEQRAEAFLNAFGEIEQVLRRQLRAQASTTFSQLLIDATKRSPAVRQFEVDLREYAELRNAIINAPTGMPSLNHMLR